MKKEIGYYLDFIEVKYREINKPIEDRRYVLEKLINIRALYLKNILNKSLLLDGFKTLMILPIQYTKKLHGNYARLHNIPMLIQNKHNNGIVKMYIHEDETGEIEFVDNDLFKVAEFLDTEIANIYGTYYTMDGSVAIKSKNTDYILYDVVYVEAYLSNPTDYYRMIKPSVDVEKYPLDIDDEHFSYIMNMLVHGETYKQTLNIEDQQAVLEG